MRTNPATVLATLDTAISRLGRVDVDGLAHVELLELLRAQHRLVCRMQAQRTRLISAVRSRGAVVADAAPSTAAWLRTQLHIGDSVAQLRAATVTEVLPAVADGYARGEFSLEHVEVIASVAKDFRPAALARADRRLALEAARRTPDGLRMAVVRMRNDNARTAGGGVTTADVTATS